MLTGETHSTTVKYISPSRNFHHILSAYTVYYSFQPVTAALKLLNAENVRRSGFDVRFKRRFKPVSKFPYESRRTQELQVVRLIICNGDVIQQLSINHGTISRKDSCPLEQKTNKSSREEEFAANSLPVGAVSFLFLKLPT